MQTLRKPLLSEWRYWPAVALWALIVVAMIGVSSSGRPPSQKNNSASEKYRHDSPIHDNSSSLFAIGAWATRNHDAIEALSAIFTLLLTFWLTVSTTLLWKATNKQAQLTKLALDHIITTDITTQRAYLARTGINFVVNVTDDGKAVRKLVISPVWVNQGRTPAKNVRFCSSKPVIVASSEDIPPQYRP